MHVCGQVAVNTLITDVNAFLDHTQCRHMRCGCGQVAVNTVITDVNAFLDHIVAATNMRCLTPPSALTGECGFLAANLYAKSVFGEDALVNVSIEQGPDGRLAGFIRIRRALPECPWARYAEAVVLV